MQEVNKKDETVLEGEISSEDSVLKAEILAKNEAIKELENKVLRLHADMDNLRKRTLREKEETWQIAVSDVLVQLLPIIDNFDRAMKVMPQSDWAQGISMVSKQLHEVLTRLGLECISTQGAFDPQYHEAVMQDLDSSQPENAITGEFERGYMFRGKVLRPSKVRVSIGGNNNV